MPDPFTVVVGAAGILSGAADAIRTLGKIRSWVSLAAEKLEVSRQDVAAAYKLMRENEHMMTHKELEELHDAYLGVLDIFEDAENALQTDTANVYFLCNSRTKDLLQLASTRARQLHKFAKEVSGQVDLQNLEKTRGLRPRARRGTSSATDTTSASQSPAIAAIPLEEISSDTTALIVVSEASGDAGQPSGMAADATESQHTIFSRISSKASLSAASIRTRTVVFGNPWKG